MAKKHKAPTEVTIAPTSESPVQTFVQRTWKIGVLLALVVLGIAVANHYMRKKAVEAEHEGWDRFRQDVELGSSLFGGITVPSSATLATLADEVADEPAGPWATGLLIHQQIAERKYNEAIEQLQKLQRTYPDHPLAAGVFRFDEDGSPEAFQDHVYRNVEALRSWEQKHASLFENPPLPADAPKVRLNTSKGSILVGLYADKAPQHVENFLKLCREGYYAGTRFHRIDRSFMIQGGDPNSRDLANPSEWGMGGPDYKIEPEPSDLRHFPYVLAAAKTATDRESSGSQFYITVGSPHHLDGVHTIFGVVLDGKNVVDEIAAGEIEPDTADRPRDPVELRSTDVVE